MVTENELKELGQSLQFQDSTAYVKIDPKTKDIVYQASEGERVVLAAFNEDAAYNREHPEELKEKYKDEIDQANKRADEKYGKEISWSIPLKAMVGLLDSEQQDYVASPTPKNSTYFSVPVGSEIDTLVFEAGVIEANYNGENYGLLQNVVYVFEQNQSPTIVLPKELLQQNNFALSELNDLDNGIITFREQDNEDHVITINLQTKVPDTFLENPPKNVILQIGDEKIEIELSKVAGYSKAHEEEKSRVWKEVNEAIDAADTGKGRQR